MEHNDQTIQEALRLAATPAGQQLISLLQKNNAGQLQKAMDQAATGDLSQTKQILSALLQDPQAKKLMDELRK